MGSTSSSTVERGPAVPIPLAGTLLAGRRARLLAGAAVILVVSGAIVATRVSSAPAAAPLRTAAVARGTVTQTVAVSGSVNPATQTRLSFKSAGRLAETLVAVGQTVTVGQALARLDTTDLEIALRQAQANLLSAQAKYDQTVAGASAEDIAIAKNAVDSAQRTFEQTQRSTQDDLTSAQQSVDNAKRALDQTKISTSNDVTTALQALSKVKTNYSSARSTFSTLVSGIRTDVASYQAGIASARSLIASTLTFIPDRNPARDSLLAADLSLSNAASYAAGGLQVALSDTSSAADAVTAAASGFDTAIAAGLDVGSAVSQYQSAQTSYSLAAARLSAAFDAPGAQITGALGSLAAAQTTLTTGANRDNDELNTPRANVATLQSSLTTEAQLALAVKSKVTQAGTALGTVTDSVGGSYLSAQQAYNAALAKSDTSVQAAQNAVTAAQQSLAGTQDKSTSSVVSQENALRSAQLSLNKTTASPKSYDITQALATLTLQQIAVDKAKNDLNNATLSAPSAGVIASISSLPGEFVAGGSTNNPFMVLSNTSSVALHGTVGEADVAKLKVGQVATVTVDAIGSATRLTGRVTSLDPVATIQQGVPVYGVDVTVDIVDTGVRPGMTGTANVIIASRQNVLTVPNLAIRNQNGRRFVQVMRGGQAEDADVTFGIANDTVTEVVSGLQDGDLVVLPAPRAAASGQPTTGGAFPGPGGGGGIQIRR